MRSEKSKTVLCIDDDPSNVTLRSLFLESSGFEALTASSVTEGLSICESKRIDAVVVNGLMADLDGGAVSARIKQMKPSVPVIMLADTPRAEAASKVIDAFVQKGDDPSQLASRLESLIRLRSHSHPELEKTYVVFADDLRRYVDCSDGVCQLLGFSRMELLNMKIDDVSYRAEKVPALFEQYASQGKMDGQYILRHKNGTPVFINYQAHVFPDGCMAAVWEPINDWKQLYQTAMLEFEPGRLEEKVEVANTAVQNRIRELRDQRGMNPEERQELEDALSGLRVLSRDFAPKSERGN